MLDHLTFRAMEKALDAAVLRQRVIANNIANADTPGFKRSDVRFESLLRAELEGRGGLVGLRTDPRHIPIGSAGLPEPEVVTDRRTVMNNNLNNVDIDAEMSALAANQLRYNVLVQQVSHEIRLLRTAIGGRP
ncbi:MAG: flagellar basal-body rod protein FlgB [Candidatus Reconcilbacillus cellulovorans]|uniref:Flagellar basal body rod protein FlgB n=1 Tax=Candidatus Reconcilbacillus cellulovorans TaxID=1906605 RepID=A0A2A6E2S7_9BACL|nr:MAG: flagellar basal-body rod protein FlgB [Candidatus Reconcilbacillus cellulovorans]